MEAQRIKNSQNKYKKNKMGGNLLNQMYQEFIELQKIRLWYWRGKSQINPRNVTENPKTDAFICGNLNYGQGGNTNQ